VPQSTVADITLKGMVNLYRKLPPDCDIVFNIHDEIVIQFPKCINSDTVDLEETYMKNLMIKCMSISLTIDGKTFTIPVGIKTGMNWNEVS
jgi:DNA polymerase I-like protein with 3'-5' exonuclease and polymerase domains